MASPPVLAEVFRVGPEPGIEPVRYLFVVVQIVSEQGQRLSFTPETLAGLQGQGEQLGFLPAAGLQVNQYGQATGVEVADAAQQLQGSAFWQVLQAVDQQR